jgi:hypothetical protein
MGKSSVAILTWVLGLFSILLSTISAGEQFRLTETISQARKNLRRLQKRSILESNRKLEVATPSLYVLRNRFPYHSKTVRPYLVIR